MQLMSRFWPGVGSLFPRLSYRRTQFAPRGQKLGQADDVVGGHGEDENGADLGEGAHLHRSEPADRLRPCAITGSQTASSIHTNKSSTSAATPGTSIDQPRKIMSIGMREW